MSKGAREIAILMRNTAKAAAKHQIQGITIGTVRKAWPDLRIQPLSGSIALPDEVLRWTTHSAFVKEDLEKGDQVLMCLSNSIYYILGEVSFDGEIVAGGGGDPDPGTGLYSVVSVNSTTTLAITDEIALVTGGVTVNLPPDHTSGQAHTIKDAAGTARTNPITVSGSGGDTIDGAPTDLIDTAWASVTYLSNGTNWFRI